MKTYQSVQIVVTLFLKNDVLTNSNSGQHEGVSDLNPSTAPDWFSTENSDWFLE